MTNKKRKEFGLWIFSFHLTFSFFHFFFIELLYDFFPFFSFILFSS